MRRFSTAAPREQPHRVVVLGLGLRRRPLALGLLNAQRNQTNDARYCVHLHLKVVGGTAPKPPLYRRLCLRRRPLALQAPCARGLAGGSGSKAHPHRRDGARVLESSAGGFGRSLGDIGTHEAAVVVVNQRPNLSEVVGLN